MPWGYYKSYPNAYYAKSVIIVYKVTTSKGHLSYQARFQMYWHSTILLKVSLPRKTTPLIRPFFIAEGVANVRGEGVLYIKQSLKTNNLYYEIRVY